MSSFSLASFANHSRSPPNATRRSTPPRDTPILRRQRHLRNLCHLGFPRQIPADFLSSPSEIPFATRPVSLCVAPPRLQGYSHATQGLLVRREARRVTRIKKARIMPIYEYVCNGCGGGFERLVASRKAKVVCPECGSKSVTRQFSTFAAHRGPNSSQACAAAGKCPTAKTCPSRNCPFSS